MKSFVRYRKNPERRIPEKRYPSIRSKIGYLYRGEGTILSLVFSLSDADTVDGAMLRTPRTTFTEAYYSNFMVRLKNDIEQEAAAVYFDPYMGQLVVVGSKQLYLDARAIVGAAANTKFLEDESPFRFDPLTYGEYFDVSGARLTYEEYFIPDVTGVTVADCMVMPTWDDNPAPWRCAMDFFDRYFDRISENVREQTQDMLTTLLASMVAAGNHGLLVRLFVLIPQTLTRFAPVLREEAKFREAKITVPAPAPGMMPPQIFNLFQYTMLMGDPDVMQTLFRFYERPMAMEEMLHHPMYYHVGFYHIRRGNYAALSVLLAHRFNPDCTDAAEDRTSLVSLACRCRRPAMVSLLVDWHCSIDKRDNHSLCALDYAAAAGDAACLSALLSAKEDDPRLRDAVGRFAAELPFDDDNQALLCILRNYMK